ncbi:protein kinase domain-containing protein [Nakamurella endophytica]|uniref:protein kinase domain-containing protein n=1 Tax=Nakamurella endophytica TaxID=1748367 RepID=UPI00166B0A9D|nr:NERD domain-containing protein [Nakamurella endophytica]
MAGYHHPSKVGRCGAASRGKGLTVSRAVAPRTRWIEVSPSEYAHERAGLAYLKTHLPNAAPYRVWTNFEFMDGNGRWHEVDALVLGRGRLHLVELKHYTGRIGGNERTWERANGRLENSPLLLARRKAQRLASRLADELRKWARERGYNAEELARSVPFIQEAVFLHAEDLRLELLGLQRANLFGMRGNRSQLPDIIDRLTEAPSGEPIRDLDGDKLAVVLGRLGIARRPTRVAGSWQIEGAPIAEGDGWQDWPATHQQDPDRQARIRIFPSPAGSPDTVRSALRRRIEREFALLRDLRHDAIVAPIDLVEDDRGEPGLVYPVDDDFRPLDLLERPLTGAEQRAVLERSAEALAYAHRHNVAHRGLTPRAIRVQLPAAADQEPRVQLADWSWAGRVHQPDTGLASRLGAPSDYSESDGSGVYEAPEGRWSSAADRPGLDIFALGAVAYEMLTGGPPAADRATLRLRVREENGLDLFASGAPFTDQRMRDLVLAATRPKVSERLPSAQKFAEQLAALRSTATADVDPLLAAVDVVIADRFKVLEDLGSGSTAKGLRVLDLPHDRQCVLKIALDDVAAERLEDEAEVLRSLDQWTGPTRDLVVRLLDGTPPVGTERSALLLSDGGEDNLARRLRFGPEPLSNLRALGTDLLTALVELDRIGVLHRDIKPANLGLRRRIGGKPPRLTLFDFSLSRGRIGALEAGTPPYLDPFLNDPHRGVYDSAADWYGAAVVLFEMATGEAPRYGDGLSDPATIADEVSVEAAGFPADLPRPVIDGLVPFFQQALARDSRQRFGTPAQMLAAWTAALDATEAGAGTAVSTKRQPRRAAAPPFRPVSLDDVHMPAGLAGLDQLVTELGRRSGSSNSNTRKLVYLLVPRSPVDDPVDPLDTQAALGSALGITPASVSQQFGKLAELWRDQAELRQALEWLRAELDNHLAADGGVAAASTAVNWLLDVLPTGELTAPRRTATGLLRLLLELDTRWRPDSAWQRRRHGRTIATVARDPLRLDQADAVANRAGRLLREGTELGRWLVPAAVAVPALREAFEALSGQANDEVGSAVPDRVLLELAATASAVGLSAAGELHSVDAPVEAAVEAVLQGLPDTAEVAPDHLEQRLTARFPHVAATLPRRPGLDNVVRAVRPSLGWSPERRAYVSPVSAAVPETLATRLTTHGRPPVPGRTVSLSWARLGDGPVFRAVQVPTGYGDDLAAALVSLIDAQHVDVSEFLLSAMERQAAAGGVPWWDIVAADAGSAQDRQGLAAFVQQQLPALFDQVERGSRPVVLTDLSVLASYGLLPTLSRWADVTRPPPRTILALVPAGTRPGTVDGASLVLNSPEQSVVLSSDEAAALLAVADDRAHAPVDDGAR